MSDTKATLEVKSFQTKIQVETTETILVITERNGGRLREVARKAIVALLDARDFLAYQLSHANGGMDDTELEQLAQEYLRREAWDDEQLCDSVAELAELIPDRLDADVIMTVFACNVDQASRVLTRVATAAVLPGSATLPVLMPSDNG
jgi:hypothetical protein